MPPAQSGASGLAWPKSARPLVAPLETRFCSQSLGPACSSTPLTYPTGPATSTKSGLQLPEFFCPPAPAAPLRAHARPLLAEEAWPTPGSARRAWPQRSPGRMPERRVALPASVGALGPGPAGRKERRKCAAGKEPLSAGVSLLGAAMLPDCLLFEIFRHVRPPDLLAAGRVCRQWRRVARDEVLWKRLFYRHYGVACHVPRHPAAASWFGEFRRLCDAVPRLEVQSLREHAEPVLHLSFSHSGLRFASCSKDCTVKIWNNDRQISLLHSTSMKKYNWSYTQFSQFNADDSLLLVSGVFMGPRSSSSGEIAVIGLENFELLSRVRNKPYDVFGCWLNETNLISSNLHRIGFLTSCSVLWLNNAFQGVESENVNVVKRLFKIQNLNASTVRTVMVVDCSRYSSAEELTSPGEQGGDEGSASPCQEGPPEETEERAQLRGFPAAEGEAGTEDGLDRFLSDIMAGHVRPIMTEMEMETKVARLLARNRTKPPEPNLLSLQGGKKKYLVFSTGCLTYSPHQIGIKQILPHQMTTAGPVLGEERNSDRFFDSLDHVIDIHGHIIGMGLSPDHRYLYVNSRAWPEGCVISDPLQPPPIAEEIELRVLDLKTMKEAKRALRAHRAFTPSEEFNFIFLDVSRDFVASGAEDRHGYIWDRHYDICLAKLRHDDVVNSVAFSPVEQELLLTACADSTIKVWRSPCAVRVLHTEKPRLRGRLFSWATKQRT
ncbi:F-box/WD repeat-containing protein 5 [Crotalus tigris]|uniref:F-box/WD repeat-containing protein 5 n=1 Tax=Crotalus tigris TaxID=88082 RepID=UPI00192F298F|nr:F-box/WD repeat-containing protein 5 [Crotalus tigris]